MLFVFFLFVFATQHRSTYVSITRTRQNSSVEISFPRNWERTLAFTPLPVNVRDWLSVRSTDVSRIARYRVERARRVSERAVRANNMRGARSVLVEATRSHGDFDASLTRPPTFRPIFPGRQWLLTLPLRFDSFYVPFAPSNAAGT